MTRLLQDWGTETTEEHTSDEIYARYLLKNLVHIRQRGAVEMAVLVHIEEVPEAALLRLQHDVFDGSKLHVNVGIIRR